MTTIAKSSPGGTGRSPHQTRTIGVLTGAQVLGGIGVATGVTLSTLAATELSGSEAIGGLAQSSAVLGAAVVAVPMARYAASHGRRPALVMGYACGTVGSLLAVAATATGSWPLLMFGLLLLGGGAAAGLAARYTATDLSAPGHTARDLGIVVWATTIGSVAGPNLAQPADDLGRHLGLASNGGPYLLTALAFALAGVGIAVLLRPDPLRVATAALDAAADAAHAAGPAPDAARRPQPAARGGGLRALRASPVAMVAVAGVVVSHTVMVAVMSMTPVHLHHGDASLTVVGIVISLHIAGMYMLSPLVGMLADRAGRIPVMLLAMALLIVASVLAGLSSPHDVTLLSVALVILGIGWSCGLVAGSAMLSEAIPPRSRPAVQGLSDLMMNGGAALGGLAAGVVVAVFSYGALAAISVALVVPMTVALARILRVSGAPAA